MLYDKARIFVQGGAGGDGAMSFRREAHVPRGGPDGGDGGRGGEVVLVCDDSLRDLQTFKRRAHYKRGPRPARRRCAALGRARASRSWCGCRRVPRSRPRRARSHDLVVPGQRVVVARGGAGGRGNKRFASATRQAPRFAERGLPGDEGWLEMRLKLLADVGLVGLPNAGKSSLLARMTRAAPKVADYPFTTLEPVLGTFERGDRQLVLADIPGLIEGASGGAGLGHEFLAHVERTRVLVHVLELAPLDGSDPVANHATIEAELALHDPRLAELPRVLALSKADLLPAEDVEAARAAWAERVGDVVPVLATSSATGEGLEALGDEVARLVPLGEGVPQAVASDAEALAEHVVFRPAAGRDFAVEQTGPGAFRVTGDRVERLLLRFDLGNDEALAHVEARLVRMGVVDALAAAGFESGDEVEIAGVVFELDPATG